MREITQLGNLFEKFVEEFEGRYLDNHKEILVQISIGASLRA